MSDLCVIESALCSILDVIGVSIRRPGLTQPSM